MALTSLARTLSDRLSYLQDWKFNFQKTRVIGSLRYLDEALERYLTTPFFVKFNRRAILYYPVARGDHGIAYGLFYEDALFLNYIVRNWKFDTSRLSKYELEDYNLAVQKLQDWEKVKKFSTEVKGLIGEIKYIMYFRRLSHSRFQSFMWGFPKFEFEVLAKYDLLMKDLNDFPVWQQRVKKEVLPYIKLLGDQTVFTPQHLADSPFAQFQKNEFFK